MKNLMLKLLNKKRTHYEWKEFSMSELDYFFKNEMTSNRELESWLNAEETEYDLTTLIAVREYRKKFGGHLAKFFTDKKRHLYKHHLEFFKAPYHQRMFMAANRVGKTTGGAFEITCHLTGQYPFWWSGHRFDKANKWWVCGKSHETIRQILQPMLLGSVGEFGSGMIPKDMLDFDSLKDVQKADGYVSSFRVKHINGGTSSVEFKSYESGRGAFEGTERSVWCDEEPPLPVYTEALARTTTGNCIFMMTFTPLQGASDVVNSFSENGTWQTGPLSDNSGKYVQMTTWDDCPHISEKMKEQLILSFPPYQRDARTKGIPSLGSGAIYPVSESDYVVDPFQIPDHWKFLTGLDVGWNKTAAVFAAIDPDSDVTYIFTEHYMGEAVPAIHAEGIKAKGKGAPVVIDTAARGRSQADGESLFTQYTDLGLELINANKAVEAGLWEVLQLFQSGQLKIFSTCSNMLQEIRGYNRDEKGKVIKKNDHLCDALRYLVMGRDNAKQRGKSYAGAVKPQRLRF